MRRREPRRGASGRVEAAVEVGTERGRGHDHGLGTDAGAGQGRGQNQETGGGLGTHKKSYSQIFYVVLCMSQKSPSQLPTVFQI